MTFDINHSGNKDWIGLIKVVTRVRRSASDLPPINLIASITLGDRANKSIRDVQSACPFGPVLVVKW
jgi:hypothetical protein